MQIGFNLPNSGPMAEPATIARVARLGEELGFVYLTLTDHVALPDTSVPGYPYSESGAFYSPDPGRRFELLAQSMQGFQALFEATGGLAQRVRSFFDDFSSERAQITALPAERRDPRMLPGV